MKQEFINKIFLENCYTGLQKLQDKTVHCCVTSPPYYGLRDYGLPPHAWPPVTYSLFGFEITIPAMECCLGLEPTPQAFIGHIVLIFREVKRVLHDDGTLWLNFGDSYAGSTKGAGNNRHDKGKQGTNVGSIGVPLNRPCINNSSLQGKKQTNSLRAQENVSAPGLKPKDLIGIPWIVAFALRDDGWYLRSDIIWHKPNPMPESVTDRPTKAHEYIFLLSKSQKYYYDAEAIKENITESTLNDKRLTDEEYQAERPDRGYPGAASKGKGLIKPVGDILKRNKRTVWSVTPKPFSEAHFATFPQDLIIDCIKAGCPENGIVLDPFMGAGTTALVASKLNRNYVGFELNEKYLKIAERRLFKNLGLFMPVAV